jgi:hypothetical protein
MFWFKHSLFPRIQLWILLMLLSASYIRQPNLQSLNGTPLVSMVASRLQAPTIYFLHDSHVRDELRAMYVRT